MQKILEVKLLFVDFSKAFDSIHREKMEQIFLANPLRKETVAATNHFVIDAGVLQGKH